MIFLLVFALYSVMARTAVIPELATLESCTNWHFVVTDKNVRKAIDFFRSCRNLGLTMGDLLPQDYMKTLATKLKTTNYQFLQQTNFAQPKLRMFEREFNDLYQEITILSEKVVGSYRSHDNPLDKDKKCTCTINVRPTVPTRTTKTTTTTTTTSPPRTTKTTTTTPNLIPNINQDDPSRLDPFDYDYGSTINACSEAAFYFYLLAVALLSLFISIWTCRLSCKTYRILKESQFDDDEPHGTYTKASTR